MCLYEAELCISDRVSVHEMTSDARLVYCQRNFVIQTWHPTTGGLTLC